MRKYNNMREIEHAFFSRRMIEFYVHCDWMHLRKHEGFVVYISCRFTDKECDIVAPMYIAPEFTGRLVRHYNITAPYNVRWIQSRDSQEIAHALYN